ncbi:MAG: hypothetical protein HC831_16070 [Chloroflexia bacterium]|nr:hypothetical protein [Chloroflexia bacterium]
MKGLFTYDEDKNVVDTFFVLGKDFAGADLGVVDLLQRENEFWISLYSNKLKNNSWQGVAHLIINDKDSFSVNYSFSKIIPQKVALVMYNDDKYLWIGKRKRAL